MFNFTDKLKKLRGKESQDDFAKRFGLHRNTVSQYERGVSHPDSGFLAKLADYYNVDVDWLINDEATTLKNSSPVDPNEFIYIPRVEASLAAGHGSPQISDEIIEELAFKRDWIRTKGNPKNMVLMSVRGDSMEPIISDEDLIMIDQSKKDIRPGKLFAVGFEEYIFVKRLMLEPGNLILRSENKEYKDININLRDEDIADQVRIIGRVIWWCHDER